MRRCWPPLLGCLLLSTVPSSARAYITAPVQTLGQLCGSTYITLVQVEKLSKEKGVIIYRKVRDLKGTYPQERIRHAFDLQNTPLHKGLGDVPVRPDATDWRYALQWAEVGKTAVVFSLKYDPYGDFGHTYIDRCWYATMCPNRDWDFWWSIYSDPALLSRWHCGTPAQLASAVEQMLSGKTAVVPTLEKGSRDDLRQGRGTIRGLKAGLQILDFNPVRDRVAGWLPREIPDVVKDLEHSDPRVRLQALKDLGVAGSAAKAATSNLLPLLRDSDDEMRLTALHTLGLLEPEDPRIVPGTLPFVKHAVPERRILAARILAQTPARVRTAGAALTGLLQEPEVQHRLQIVELLSQSGLAVPEVAAAAAGLLEEPSPEIRRRAMDGLVRLGSAAKPAVPALIKALKDADRAVRIQAAATLGAIGPEAKSAVPALAETVRADPSGTVRMRSAEALGKLGPEARAARPALDAALKDPAMAARPEVLEKIREILGMLK